MSTPQGDRFPEHPRLPHKPPDIDEDEWRYVRDFFQWYDAAASRARYTYWTLKIFTLVAGAVITTLAARGESSAIIAGLAAGALVAEGIQQTGQFHANYIAYRLIAENVSMHAWLFTFAQEPYSSADPVTRMRVLASNIANMVSSQNSDWSSRMLQSTQPLGTADEGA